ncbi:hypothetical protein [Variovorax boronicumulans]|uniref:hypothetical protein n=1 Tax=Variovorax boronicumulans TaxID=436515 RepID=UPI001C57C6EA
MLHPLYATVLGHPELIAEHVGNYAALIKLEAAQAGRGLGARIAAGVVAAIGLLLALGLAGVAAMLYGMEGRFHWTLVAIPAGSLFIAVIAGWIACRPLAWNGLAEVRAQFDEDLRALHAAGGRRGD